MIMWHRSCSDWISAFTLSYVLVITQILLLVSVLFHTRRIAIIAWHDSLFTDNRTVSTRLFTNQELVSAPPFLFLYRWMRHSLLLGRQFVIIRHRVIVLLSFLTIRWFSTQHVHWTAQHVWCRPPRYVTYSPRIQVCAVVGAYVIRGIISRLFRLWVELLLLHASCIYWVSSRTSLHSSGWRRRL